MSVEWILLLAIQPPPLSVLSYFAQILNVVNFLLFKLPPILLINAPKPNTIRDTPVVELWVYCSLQQRMHTMEKGGTSLREFPGSPVVGTPWSHCQGPEFPGRGTRIPHAVRCGQKIKTKQPKKQNRIGLCWMVWITDQRSGALLCIGGCQETGVILWLGINNDYDTILLWSLCFLRLYERLSNQVA